MEKIYIWKTIFEMDKESKDLIESYINSLKEYVLENSIDIDIYEDIKVRVEEKLHWILQKKSVIAKSDIEEIIKQLWKPQEIFSWDWAKKWFSLPKFKKLYKDSKNWKILWVCYGLAKSNDLEPLWVRLCFIFVWVFFPVFTIIVYLVLAVILPERSEIVIEHNVNNDWVIERLFNAIKRVFQKIIDALK